MQAQLDELAKMFGTSAQAVKEMAEGVIGQIKRDGIDEKFASASDDLAVDMVTAYALDFQKRRERFTTEMLTNQTSRQNMIRLVYAQLTQ